MAGQQGLEAFLGALEGAAMELDARMQPERSQACPEAFQAAASRFTAESRNSPQPNDGSRSRMRCKGLLRSYPARSSMNSTISGLVYTACETGQLREYRQSLSR